MNNQAKVIISGEDKLSTVFASVGRSADKLGLNLDGLKGGAVAALGALAVPVSAGALVALANEARQAIDEFKDLSDATGASLENISALDGIIRETGGSLADASGVLIKFNAVLKDADPEKGAGAVLKALNLDIAELKRLDPAEALRRTAVALQGYADNGDKARAVQELFGKSVKEAGPFLKDLAEAGALNARITSKQAEEVDRFNKELFKLQATARDASRSMSVDIITDINAIIDKFREGRKESRSFWSTLFLSPDEMAQKNKRTGARFDKWDSFWGIQREDEASAETARLGRAGNLYSPDNQSAAELARLTRRPSLNVPGDPDKPNARTGGRSAGRDPYAEANRYLDNLRNQLQATEDLTAYEKLLADIRSGNLGRLTPQLQAQLEQTAKLIDADKEMVEITKQFADIEAEAARKRQELQDAAQGFYEATRTPIERLNIELARQLELLEKLGPSYQDTYMRATEAAQERYDQEGKTAEEVKKGLSLAEEFGATFSSAFEDAIVGGKGLGDVLQGLEQDIMRMVTRKMVTEPLGNFVSDALSGSDLFSNIFGGFRATGGPVQSGKGYVVGEDGPEWFEPATSGMVVPNHALQGGGTTIHQSISVTMPNGASRSTGQQFGREIARQLSVANARNG